MVPAADGNGMTPQDVIDAGPMTRVQVIAVAFAILLNALDGLDVLTISFAAPLIAREWGLGPSTLGIVLSTELIGMVLGSLVLGGLADRFGRRPLVLLCLTTMALFTLLSAAAGSIGMLCLCRVMTGIGIGGMVPVVTAIAAEFSSRRRRNLCLALSVVGYSSGAMIGGFAIAALLERYDWRAVFLFAGGIILVVLPLAAWLLAESVPFLASRRGLEAANAGLHRLGLRPAGRQEAPCARRARAPLIRLFTNGRASRTALVALAYFGQIFTFYFVIKWMTKIVVDFGFDPATAARVLAFANVGGVAGGILFGLVAQRIDVRRLTMVVLLTCFAAVVAFGQRPPSYALLVVTAVLAGLFANTGVAGIYAVVGQAFPADLRATGTGFVAAAGRGTAILSPILAGQMLGNGFSIGLVAAVMAAGSLVGAAALLAFPILDKRQFHQEIIT